MTENQLSSEYQMIQEAETISEERVEKKGKKRCRGNRKMQRYRRNLRKQSMKSGTTIQSTDACMETDSSISISVTKNNEQTVKLIDTEAIDYSSRPMTRKKRKINKKNVRSKSIHRKKVRRVPIIHDVVDYTTVSDEIFLQMLSKAFIDAEQLNSILNEEEKIKFIRRFTSLIDRVCYLRLQENQWKYYHHIGITQNIWKGRISKHLAAKYSICYTYGRSKAIIQQRLNQIERQLQEAHSALQQFERDTINKFSQCSDIASIMKYLSDILHQFVQEKQRFLEQDFEYKRQMLIFDATDHMLLEEFFHLKPNKSHVILVLQTIVIYVNSEYLLRIF